MRISLLPFLKSLPDSLHLAPVQPCKKTEVINCSQVVIKKVLNQTQLTTLKDLLRDPLYIYILSLYIYILTVSTVSSLGGERGQSDIVVIKTNKFSSSDKKIS